MVPPVSAAAAMYYIGPFGGMVIATVVLYFCRTPYNALVDRVLMACIHDTPGEYGKFRMGGSMGYGVGALIAGAVYSAHACKPLFFMYIPAIIATGPLWLVMVMNIIGGMEFSIMWAAATQLVEADYPPEAGFVAQTLKSVFNTSVGYGLGCIMLSAFYDKSSLKAGYAVLFAVNAACVLFYGFLALKGRKANER